MTSHQYTNIRDVRRVGKISDSFSDEEVENYVDVATRYMTDIAEGLSIKRVKPLGCFGQGWTGLVPIIQQCS